LQTIRKFFDDLKKSEENICKRLERNRWSLRRLKIDPEGGQVPTWTVDLVEKNKKP